jgi:YfiH family protein
VLAFTESRDRVEVAFTDRHRPSVDDALELAGWPEARPVGLHQVHGAAVHVADDVPDEPPHADGVVTTLPGLALTVRAADCVPLLLADQARPVIGAAHCGRPGLVAGVVAATVALMRSEGADRIVAWVGPHVCGRCYEVPAQMRDDVAALVPAAYAETSWGTPSVDLGRGVRAQLEDAGVEVVHEVGRCTLEDLDLFSYRREGAAAGRQAGLIWIRP